jgi:aminopeptidase N
MFTAKLLHDSWNLAYSGSLNFATALNMTLFMKHEREHMLWNPIFTMIDHIGRHIDISSVHTKFNMYFAQLLQPLYTELEQEKVDDEEKSKTNLRNLASTFLCRAGYKPCIEEAQIEFKKWIESEKPDDENP